MTKTNILFNHNLILYNSSLRLRAINENDVNKFASIATDLINVWQYFACKMENADDMAARKALLKIGATEEGVLRSHTLMPDNRRRDTLYYSILRNEWPNLILNVFDDCHALEISKD